MIRRVGCLGIGIKPGILILDPKNAHFTPLNNAKHQLVYTETGRSVETSAINGKVVMEDKMVLMVALDKIVRDIHSMLGASGDR